MSKTVADRLAGMLDRDFNFPIVGEFEVRGVAFRIDSDPDGKRDLFGSKLHLWADGTMIHAENEIVTPGGMGQVNHTYGTLEKLRTRLDAMRKARERVAQDRKRSEVEALLA